MRAGHSAWWLVALACLAAGPADDVRTGDITARSVRAVDRALAWLAEHQNADGSWSAHVGYKLNLNYEITARIEPHPGVTALGGMAFLAAGHLPGRGPYGQVIGRATDYLLSRVTSEGYVSDSGTRMYSHAFATLYLAEVYGMSDTPGVRRRLQAAVDFIVGCQNGEGAWRYEAHAVESDMSITVCQLNALRAARNVGIRVPKSTIDRAAAYVARSYISRESDYQPGIDRYYDLGRGAFSYQVLPGTRSSFALTAAGLAALQNTGLHGQSAGMAGGKIDLEASIEFLRNHFTWVSGADSHWTFHYFYWYGHYYATQALYIVGGRAWEWYYPAIRDELIEAQAEDGSLPCTTGPGETFSTSVGALILSVPYGYLPIFQR